MAGDGQLGPLACRPKWWRDLLTLNERTSQDTEEEWGGVRVDVSCVCCSSGSFLVHCVT